MMILLEQRFVKILNVEKGENMEDINLDVKLDKGNKMEIPLKINIDCNKLIAQAKLEAINDLFDELYFEKFDEIKHYDSLKYKKDMKKKFIEIDKFFRNKARKYAELKEGKE